MANDHVIEEIKQRLPLEEYIGRAVDLKRYGRTYKACCPFHAEKTPSFVVFPHTQTWHCFGACGDGGDIFSFVQKREGLSFAEAMAQLARQAGIELQEESPQQQAERSERERYYAICAAAQEFYSEALRTRPDAQSCRDYIARRGISAEAANRFGLGYAPDQWEALLSALTARGYTPEDLALLGLARQRENGSTYDYFRHRLMFPIRDVRGRVIGFGARALSDEQNPKYLNSPQTPLFDKGRNLYALELARDSIRTENRAVVVEGYMDAIAAHEHGFANVVASLGTALTARQLQLLSRYSPNITLALDADEAGQKAAERGLDTVLALQQELKSARWEQARQGKAVARQPEGDVRVLVLPDGDDPDDLIRRESVRWKRLVAEALPLMEYLIQRRTRTSDLRDPVQKARVADELLPLIADIESAVVRDHYVRQLARVLQTDERTLAQELAKPQSRRGRSAPTAARESAKPGVPHDAPPLDEYELPPEAYENFEAEEFLDGVEPPAPTAVEEAARTASYAPGTHEGYALYLLLEQPARIAEAQQYGARADMWLVTEHREIWDALVANPPASSVHIEEFAGHLVPPIAQRLRAIIHYYAEFPPLTDDAQGDELLNQLDSIILRHDAEQERRLQYLIDDLQRTEEYDRAELLTFQQQLYRLSVQRFQRQRQQQECITHRKRVAPPPAIE